MVVKGIFVGCEFPKTILRNDRFSGPSQNPPPMDELSKIWPPREKDQSAGTHTPSKIGNFFLTPQKNAKIKANSGGTLNGMALCYKMLFSFQVMSHICQQFLSNKQELLLSNYYYLFVWIIKLHCTLMHPILLFYSNARRFFLSRDETVILNDKLCQCSITVKQFDPSKNWNTTDFFRRFQQFYTLLSLFIELVSAIK